MFLVDDAFVGKISRIILPGAHIRYKTFKVSSVKDPLHFYADPGIADQIPIF